jgi:hypothetical protein
MNHMGNNKALVLFALNTNDQARELKLIRELFPMNAVAPIKGAYQGTEEDSWMLELTENRESAEIEKILGLAGRFNQHGIMVVDENRAAQLIFVSSRLTQDLGRLHGVAESEARTKDAWTYAPHNGTYYITE